MDDDNQIIVPPSFIALCSDARGRLRMSAAAVRDRHELCEDLACGLVERAQQLHHDAPSEQGVLAGMHAALVTPTSPLAPEEARWVVLRLAELLGWHSPELAEPGLSPR